MQSLKSIQERVNAEADKDLKMKLRELMKLLQPYLSHKDSGMYIRSGDSYHQISLHTVKENLSKVLFETCMEENRDNASKDFMSKMAQMHEQFDEMIGFEEE